MIEENVVVKDESIEEKIERRDTHQELKTLVEDQFRNMMSNVAKPAVKSKYKLINGVYVLRKISN